MSNFDSITAELQVEYLRASIATFLLDKHECPAEIAERVAQALSVKHESYGTDLVTPLELDVIAVSAARQLTRLASDLVTIDSLTNHIGLFDANDELDQVKVADAVVERAPEIILDAALFADVGEQMALPEAAEVITELKSERGAIYALFENM